MYNIENILYETKTGEPLEQSFIKQLGVLFATPVGTVPFDRDFGINQSYIDMPTSVAENMLVSELSEKVEKYIPDIIIEQIILIQHNPNMPERLKFKVVVSHAK